MQKTEIVIFPHLVPFCQALSHLLFEVEDEAVATGTALHF